MANRNLSEERLLLEEIQGRCSDFTKEILAIFRKKVKRIINSWPVVAFSCADDYPNNFKNFDIIAVEYQSKSWDEISPSLEYALKGVVETAWDEFSDKDKFFLLYSECYYNTRCHDSQEIDKLLWIEFIDSLNEHYESSKKIENFNWKRSW